ncbi:DUF5522 domain-containing protein [Flavobacterium enshiense]|uniref:DUF5522 domain-containing protein n=1 Tax=Flavobacterium enshiense TaxID=1341165 RepID=UPI00345D835B
MNVIKTKQCSSCSVSFPCGDTPEGMKCWCNDFPPIFAPTDVVDCLCPDCFKKASRAKIEDYVATVTPENASDNKAKNLPPSSVLIEGIDYDIENGKQVFKAWYHLKRGYCCQEDCLHCPY